MKQSPNRNIQPNQRDYTPILNGLTPIEYLAINYLFENGFNKTKAYNSACAKRGRDMSVPKSRQAAHNLFARPRVVEYISKQLALHGVTKQFLLARLDAMYEQDISEAIIIQKLEIGKDGSGNPIYKEIGKDEEGNIIYLDTCRISLTKIKELGLFHLIRKIKQDSSGVISIVCHRQRKREILDTMAKLLGFSTIANHQIDPTETPLVRFTRMLEGIVKNSSTNIRK